MPNCGAEGCSKPAVLQVQRLMSAAENGGLEQVTREDSEWRTESARAKQRRILAELEAEREHIDPARHHLLDRQKAAEQARLDAIVDEPALPVALRPNTIAMFCCAEHELPDAHMHHAPHCQPGHCCNLTSLPPSQGQPAGAI